MTEQDQDVLFDDDGSAESGFKSQEENMEKDLPPLASNGDISLWVDEDKNGNKFVRVDAPFLGSEPVFFHDDVKPTVNRLVEQWRKQRE